MAVLAETVKDQQEQRGQKDDHQEGNVEPKLASNLKRRCSSADELKRRVTDAVGEIVNEQDRTDRLPRLGEGVDPVEDHANKKNDQEEKDNQVKETEDVHFRTLFQLCSLKPHACC